MAGPHCRSCGAPLERVLADLGATPLANAFLRPEELDRMEPTYPLRALVCDACWLVQLDAYEAPETIFSDYAYFSSFSDTWLAHAQAYAAMAVDRFGLDESSRVVELASNDGYLLQYLATAGIPVLGVEPAANVASAARAKGIETVIRFFGVSVARELAASRAADLIIANNVLAHVPDLDGFVSGMAVLLAPQGTITIEFPHLEHLIADVQFDTIYHEHFSYFSFTTAQDVFARRGLEVFDVEEIPTHGGSLRIYVRHAGDASRPVTEQARALAEREIGMGLRGPDAFQAFAAATSAARQAVRRFFLEERAAGRRVAAYGAAAKGNTLVNYCGIGPEELAYCVDRNPHKQGTFLPGSRIPVRPPTAFETDPPDTVFIFPWNLRDEVMDQLAAFREHGGRFAWRSRDGVAVA